LFTKAKNLGLVLLIAGAISLPLSARSKRGAFFAGSQLDYEDIFSPYQGEVYGGGLFVGGKFEQFSLQFGLYYNELYGEDADFLEIGKWDYSAWQIGYSGNIRWTIIEPRPVSVFTELGFKSGSGYAHLKDSHEFSAESEIEDLSLSTTTLYSDLGLGWKMNKHLYLEAGIGLNLTGLYSNYWQGLASPVMLFEPVWYDFSQGSAGDISSSDDYYCDDYYDDDCGCDDYEDYQELVNYFFSSRVFINLVYQF